MESFVVATGLTVVCWNEEWINVIYDIFLLELRLSFNFILYFLFSISIYIQWTLPGLNPRKLTDLNRIMCCGNLIPCSWKLLQWHCQFLFLPFHCCTVDCHKNDALWASFVMEIIEAAPVKPISIQSFHLHAGISFWCYHSPLSFTCGLASPNDPQSFYNTLIRHEI